MHRTWRKLHVGADHDSGEIQVVVLTENGISNDAVVKEMLVETVMFRLKTIFGDKLSARLFENQATQALIRCLALNKMTHLGIPESYQVA